jgi:hypothetical protein
MKYAKLLRPALKGGAIATLSIAVLGAVAAPASAYSFGNTVLNCRGIYWNTAWAQECPTSSGGAYETGTYKSVGNCSAQTDPTLSVGRKAGTGTRKYGINCTFSVSGVSTSFIG